MNIELTEFQYNEDYYTLAIKLFDGSMFTVRLYNDCLFELCECNGLVSNRGYISSSPDSGCLDEYIYSNVSYIKLYNATGCTSYKYSIQQNYLHFEGFSFSCNSETAYVSIEPYCSIDIKVFSIILVELLRCVYEYYRT